MARTNVEKVEARLNTHEAVCAERWKETILRIRRLEHIMIGGGVGVGKTPHIDMNLLVDPYTGKKVYPVKGDKVKMFQGGGPAHHGPSSGVRRLSDSTHQARPRYFVRGGGVAVRGNTYRGVS